MRVLFKAPDSVFNAFNKPVLEKTALYLKIDTTNLKKPEIIHLLICKIQNVLPDTCQICNESYVSEINDPSFLACDLCGQEVHKQCFMRRLGISSIDGVDVYKLINPFQLPGFHFLCGECEKDVIPVSSNSKLAWKQPNLTTKSVVSSPPQQSSPDVSSEAVLPDSSPSIKNDSQAPSMNNKIPNSGSLSSVTRKEETCSSQMDNPSSSKFSSDKEHKLKTKTCESQLIVIVSKSGILRLT